MNDSMQFEHKIYTTFNSRDAAEWLDKVSREGWYLVDFSATQSSKGHMIYTALVQRASEADNEIRQLRPVQDDE
jgi:hypothetical protein